MKEIKWSKDFNIGVAQIDHAHQQLFTIVKMLMQQVQHEHKKSDACIKGIRYFENYCITHFAEEEEYMRKINYAGYEDHKRIHDSLKNIIVPSLEQELKDTNYSDESVSKFIGVCIGWLTGHIITIDKEITAGDIVHDLEFNKKNLTNQFVSLTSSTFHMNVNFIGEQFDINEFSNPLCFVFTFKNKLGATNSIALVVDRNIIMQTTGIMLGFVFDDVDMIAYSAAEELSEILIYKLLSEFTLIEGHTLRNTEILDTWDINSIHYKHKLQSHFVFDCEFGKFALLIPKI